MKRLFSLLCIILLNSNCSLHRDIKSRENLISDIGNVFNLSNYDVILRTKDSVFLLSDVKVSAEGKMNGMKNWAGSKDQLPLKNVENGKMVFLSNEQSQFVVKQIDDSVGKERIKRTEFSGATITKVYINGETKKGDFKIYKRWDVNWDEVKNFLSIVFKVIMVLCLILTLVGVIFIIVWFNSGGPSAFGCFIATMVYGSYDAPEVIVLRKYREEKLAPYFLGRVFIRIYYTLSPVFVKVFKNNEPIKKCIKFILDRWVRKLKERVTANS